MAPITPASCAPLPKPASKSILSRAAALAPSRPRWSAVDGGEPSVGAERSVANPRRRAPVSLALAGADGSSGCWPHWLASSPVRWFFSPWPWLPIHSASDLRHGWTRRGCERHAALSRSSRGGVCPRGPADLAAQTHRTHRDRGRAGHCSSGASWPGGARRLKRRSRGPLAWAMLGTPLDGSAAAQHFINGLWDLLRGGAPLKSPDAEDLSRRFIGVARRKSWPARLSASCCWRSTISMRDVTSSSD